MVRGLLIDLSGTLHVGERAIPGAVEAVQQLQAAGLPCRFVTNTSRTSRRLLHAKLLQMGFRLPLGHFFTAPLAVRHYLELHRLRPYLLIHPNLAEEFADLPQDEPNAVVVGFAQHAFTYAALNHAFQLLRQGAPLVATGRTRYFQGESGLELDAGPFVAALEYAAGQEAVVLGKPSPRFFLDAASELGCAPAETLMIGDDAVSDVGGALAAGLQGLLVQTGKYRPGDEVLPGREMVRTAPDIGAAVAAILDERQENIRKTFGTAKTRRKAESRR